MSKENPRYQKLNQLILNLLNNIKNQNSNNNIIIQYLEAINSEVEKFQTDKIIYINLDSFDTVNDFIHKIIQKKKLSNKNIKNILKQYNKILKNINSKERPLKKLVIATTLLAALGIGTQFSKNNEQIPKKQIITQKNITPNINENIDRISHKDQVNKNIESKTPLKTKKQMYQIVQINPQFYDNQKDEIIKVIQNFQNETQFLKHLENLNIYNKKH